MNYLVCESQTNIKSLGMSNIDHDTPCVYKSICEQGLRIKSFGITALLLIDMYLNKYGRKIYTWYEKEHGTEVSDDFIHMLKNDPNLPNFYNSIHFIEKCFNSYNDYDITIKHIHDVYEMSKDSVKYYHNATIPKRNGKERTLAIPCDELKKVQRYINDKVFTWYKPLSCVSAYVKNRGIRYNASYHVDSNYILKLDIHDFFGSIHFGKVVNNILPKEYPLELRTLLSNLCLYKGYLPQGAPTSPMLSNIVMRRFDEIMIEFTKKVNINYTRYADDMTFSSKEEFNPKLIIGKVEYLLKKYYQMILNEEKTIFLHDGLQENVCGVIVNDHMQVSKKYRDSIRQEMHYINKFGIDRHIYYLFYQKKISKLYDKNEYYRILLGKINYVLSINPLDKEFVKYMGEIRNELQKGDKKKKEELDGLYRKSLDYLCHYDNLKALDKVLYLIQNQFPIDDELLENAGYMDEMENMFDPEKFIPMERNVLYNAIMNRIENFGTENFFGDEFYAFYMFIKSRCSQELVLKRPLFAYVMLVGCMNFETGEEREKYKNYSEYLKMSGNYRGVYLIAKNEEMSECDRINLIKEAAYGGDIKAQYEYGSLMKKEDTEIYKIMILSSANNLCKYAFYDAYCIYRDYGCLEQGINYLIEMIREGDKEAIEEGKKLKEIHKYKFDKKIAGMLNRG